MNPYPHVEPIKIDLFADLVDDPDHGHGQLDDIVGFFGDCLPVVLVGHPHNHVAISDGVKFVQPQSVALDVEVGEQLRQHLNHLSGALARRKVGETNYIGKQNGDLFVVRH